MQGSYIQFETPINHIQRSRENSISQITKKITTAILGKIIPVANPEFENKIDDVITWLIECDIESGIPMREIGLDKKGIAIVKMPYRKNYGYWIDNNLLLDDFYKHFQVEVITEELFEKNWDSFQ
jgi:hypothetical protein